MEQGVALQIEAEEFFQIRDDPGAPAIHFRDPLIRCTFPERLLRGIGGGAQFRDGDGETAAVGGVELDGLAVVVESAPLTAGSIAR